MSIASATQMHVLVVTTLQFCAQNITIDAGGRQPPCRRRGVAESCEKTFGTRAVAPVAAELALAEHDLAVAAVRTDINSHAARSERVALAGQVLLLEGRGEADQVARVLQVGPADEVLPVAAAPPVGHPR